MAKLIVAYGPSASGKSTAAWGWHRANPFNRVIVEEGNFSPDFFKDRVEARLRAGIDVWMSILTESNTSTLSVELDGYEVEMRKFERRDI